MARSRNIKPSYFTNDDLAECEPLARLLFIALWTLADRAGRLEDRPKKIKAEALPYDDCDVDKLLNDLFKRGFIIRYAVDENKYIQVVNFEKHQNPHQKEATSTIPAPDLSDAGTVNSGTSRADSLLLIPDIPLIDSLIPDEVVRLWNEIVGDALPKVERLSATRKAKIKKRIDEDFGGDIAEYEKFCERVRGSPFLTGSSGWKASFDWCLESKNILKVLEGNYDGARTTGKPDRHSAMLEGFGQAIARDA